MTNARRFGWGGVGALLPLLVTLLAVDLAPIIDGEHHLTLGHYVGAAMRYLILFVLGGVVAVIHSDENKPAKLVQLGISAPALISSFVNAQQPTPGASAALHDGGGAFALTIVSPAHASGRPPAGAPARTPFVPSGFLDDASRGFAKPLGQVAPPSQRAKAPQAVPAPPTVPDGVPEGARGGPLSPESLRIKPVVLEQASVSGVSSGAYMAVQFAVVNAGYVVALGAEAGGPFFCAGDGLAFYRTTKQVPGGTGECMENGTPDISRSTGKAKEALDAGERDRLKAQKVWLYSGSNDRTVDRKVVDKLEEFLVRMGVADITYAKGAAAHGHLVDVPGGSPAACEDQATVKGAEYFADCDFDAARAVLETAYGAPAGGKAAADPGRLRAFRQEAPAEARMAETGYAYVPEACEREACRIHVAFHGCHQGEEIGDHFARRSGYSEWAEAFRAVILYPRIRRDDPINPNGCWDWWGYTDRTYNPMAFSLWSDGAYATKAAPQIRAVDAMLRRLTNGGG